jgi:hypothetical protein
VADGANALGDQVEGEPQLVLLRHEQGVQFILAGCGALASTVQIRNVALSDWFPL